MSERLNGCSAYWGVFPICGKNDGTVNVGPNHYVVCHEHRQFWIIGGNLFSSWKFANEEIWDRNRKMLEQYTRVENRNRRKTS
jgi:hypothetical protein